MKLPSRFNIFICVVFSPCSIPGKGIQYRLVWELLCDSFATGRSRTVVTAGEASNANSTESARLLTATGPRSGTIFAAAISPIIPESTDTLTRSGPPKETGDTARSSLVS